MNSNLLLPLLITTVVAVASWFVGSWLSLRRDRASKRRDLRVQYLIEAYRRLQNAGHRPLIPPHSSDMESAIADIQLFGTQSQAAAAKKLAEDLAGQGSASLDDLLLSLRAELRKELRLEQIAGGITHLRFGDKRETERLPAQTNPRQ